MAVLLKFVLFKRLSDVLHVKMSLADIQFRLQWYANFIPFKSIRYYLGGHPNTAAAVQNLAGNVLLFAPLGFFVPLLRPRFTGVIQVGALALGASLLLEVIQLLTGLGGFDVDDLILNTVGGLIGWLAFKAAQQIKGRCG